MNSQVSERTTEGINMTHGKEVDETDLKILKLLRMNARLSFREIGKQINVSTGTVSDRVKQMVEQGVIKGFVTAVAPEKMGYHISMLLEIRISHDMTLDKLEEEVTKMEEACCIQYVTGDIDMMLLVRCRDQEHATKVLDKVRVIKGVSRVESHMVLKACTLCGRCGCDCAWEPPALWKE
jgi:DNA-binding Lrp family transcriptional regulator